MVVSDRCMAARCDDSAGRREGGARQARSLPGMNWQDRASTVADYRLSEMVVRDRFGRVGKRIAGQRLIFNEIVIRNILISDGQRL